MAVNVLLKSATSIITTIYKKNELAKKSTYFTNVG